MTTLESLLQTHRDEILRLVHHHRGTRALIIGSVAKGEDRSDSDVDFVVEFAPNSSLFDLMRLESELADLIGRPVDVLSLGGLKDRDQQILDEAVAV